MYIKYFLKTIFRTVYVFLKLNYFKIQKKHTSKSKNVVLLFPNFPIDFVKYFYSDAFINDCALLNAVSNSCDDIRLVIGCRKMNYISDSKVFLNMSNRYNFNDFRNYSNSLVYFIQQLEEQNNLVIPSSKEALLWENKVYMHETFDNLEINSPTTEIVNLHYPNLTSFSKFEYPFLIKEVHSAGSNGVYKVDDQVTLNILLNDSGIKKRNKYILVQKLLNMDRDLRVIIIGDKIVLHYWRINKNDQWKPTSTKHGSKVDFDFFPMEWRDYILTQFKKLKITTGAFDIVWEDNDYKKEPIFLEISPSYQPNPRPRDYSIISYGKYKESFHINGWDKDLVEIIFKLKKDLIDQYLNNIEYTVQ